MPYPSHVAHFRFVSRESDHFQVLSCYMKLFSKSLIGTSPHHLQMRLGRAYDEIKNQDESATHLQFDIVNRDGKAQSLGKVQRMNSHTNPQKSIVHSASINLAWNFININDV